MSYKWIGLFLIAAAILGSQCADASIIKAATTTKATVTTSVTVKTTTTGQRQIILKIDPPVTSAFRLDLLYSDGLTPLGFNGFNTSLRNEAITYLAPYVPAGGASILPAGGDPFSTAGIISNVQGQAVLPAAPVCDDDDHKHKKKKKKKKHHGRDRDDDDDDDDRSPLLPKIPALLPNRPDGASDLFTLTFIDNNPDVEKTFTIITNSTPGFGKYALDNFLDVLITDPNDPRFGQIVRLTGDDIEGTTLVIPGIPKVPLPAPLLSGLVGAAGVGLTRLKRRIAKSWYTGT